MPRGGGPAPAPPRASLAAVSGSGGERVRAAAGGDCRRVIYFGRRTVLKKSLFIIPVPHRGQRRAGRP